VAPIDPEWADAPAPMTLDADTARAVANFLRDKIGDEDFAQVMQLMSQTIATDDPPPFSGRPRPGGTMDPITRTKESVAMDYSLARKIAMDQAERRAISAVNDIRQAEREVAPYVGEVMACDSASEVYRQALERQGHDTARLHPSATRAAWDMLKSATPGGRRGSYPSTVGLGERFPDFRRLGV
jgi:hypothetical protein